ncbi:uncharacterized protein LOC114399410 isoform X4 [Glycine soja]|uniref:uncharacterized protein LOC114399410 isoform X4 n=1 Tax=Glycine soja TaxID=3848 RepID=UPI00103F169D|nr:uncharacterized protein LOC114399410 isoform X4 [Glycine soja]
MMICQGTHFVLATCLAVVGVEKVNVLSFAFALRWLQEATVNLISTLASSSVLQDNACRLTCINRLKVGRVQYLECNFVLLMTTRRIISNWA